MGIKLGSFVVKQQQKSLKDLEKAVQKRITEVDRQCAVLDKLNHKLMNFFK